MIYAEAPLKYKDHIVHLDDDGSCFIVNRVEKISAPTWPELKQKIDAL